MPSSPSPPPHHQPNHSNHTTTASSSWLADTTLVTPSDLPFASRLATPTTDPDGPAHGPSNANDDADRGWVDELHTSDYRSPPPPSSSSSPPAAAAALSHEGPASSAVGVSSPDPSMPTSTSDQHPRGGGGGRRGAKDDGAEADDEDDAGLPPQHPSPQPQPQPQQQQQQPRLKKPGVGFSSTVQVRGNSLSNLKRAAAASTLAARGPTNDGGPGGQEGGHEVDEAWLGGGGPGQSLDHHDPHHQQQQQGQTASLWQAEPSPISPSADPTHTPFANHQQQQGSQPSRSGSPSAKPAKSYGAPSSTSEYDAAYRPSYARSESEGSTLSVDEQGDDEDVLYDWSGEEDLVDQEAKVEHKLGLRKDGGKKKGWGPVRLFTALFSTVLGSTLLAGCLVAVPLCVHYLWEQPQPTEHRKYVSDNVGAWFYFVAFNVLVSWYLAVLVDLLPLAVVAVVRAVWGEVTEAMKVHVETFGVVKGWIKPILYAASIWGSWAVIFQQIYDLHTQTTGATPRAAYTTRMYEVIEFLFFLMLIFCVCKIILQFIALSFHRVAFKDRLTEIEFNVAVLDRLNLYRPKIRRRGDRDGTGYSSSGYATPKSLFSAAVGGGRKDGGAGKKRSGGGSPAAGGGGGIASAFGFSSSRKGSAASSAAALAAAHRAENGEAGPEYTDGTSRINADDDDDDHSYPPGRTELAAADDEKRAGFARFAGNVGKGMRKVALHDARNVKGKQGRSDEADELTSTLNSAKVAKNLARTIYKAYRHRKRAYLLPEDFYVAFDTISAADAAFKIFDKDGNGDISKSEIKTTVMKTYKERRFLAKALQDVDQAVGSLENVIMFFGAVILFFVALSIFGVQIGTQITSLYTILIGLSFIFKSAAGNAFDSIIFLFVTHPFDTGDRCFIAGENLVVKRMGIWSTGFVRVDGTEAYYYNSVLFNLFIINVRRSGGMFENMTVQVGWDTTNEQIDELERRINNWLSQDDKRDLASSTAIMYQYIDFQRSITLTIGIPHLPTWQDWGGAMGRRTRFHAAVKFYMEQLDISFRNSPQPIRFVNPDGTDAFPQSPLPPATAVDDDGQQLPSPLPPHGGAGLNRKVSMSTFRRPSMGIPHPARSRDEGAPLAEEPMKPTLGFLPTPDERGAHSEQQMRRRKARSRKQMTIAG